MPAHSRTLPQQFNVRAEQEGWPSVCDGRLNFDAPALKALLGLWRDAAGGKTMPRRAAIRTRRLGSFLPDVTLIDYIEPKAGPHRYRFRFHGSHLARYAGDLSGRYVDEAIAAPFDAAWTLAFDTVLRFRAPLRFIARYGSLNLGHLTAESLVAPLCDANGLGNGLLASVVYSHPEALR